MPNLKGKLYSDLRLQKQDWVMMELMHKVLQVCTPSHHDILSKLLIQEPATAKRTFSSAREPTIWCTIPVLEFLLQSWENMAELPKFLEIKHAIRKGLVNINKWSRKVNDTDAFFICLSMPVFSSRSC